MHMNDIIEHIAVERRMIREDAIQSFDIFFRSTDGKMALYCVGGERVEQDVLDKIHECNIDDPAKSTMRYQAAN
jgi:protein tyrosine phosphatase (PTP) superfamily phosphohydrolase (DUF442 family)